MPAVTSRDNVSHSAGITQYFFLFPKRARRTVLWLGYEYTHTDADGDNFDLDLHSGSVGLSIPLPYELTLDLGGSIGSDDYPNFNADPPEREDDFYSASIALSRLIWEGLQASLSYNYAKGEANFDELDFDRHIATLMLAYGW